MTPRRSANAVPGASNLLELTVGQLLELLASKAAPEADGWIDVRGPEFPISERRLIAAAKRGELAVSKIGRALLVRRSELDAWIERYRVAPRAPQQQPATPSRIAHLVGR